MNTLQGAGQAPSQWERVKDNFTNSPFGQFLMGLEAPTSPPQRQMNGLNGPDTSYVEPPKTFSEDEIRNARVNRVRNALGGQVRKPAETPTVVTDSVSTAANAPVRKPTKQKSNDFNAYLANMGTPAVNDFSPIYQQLVNNRDDLVNMQQSRSDFDRMDLSPLMAFIDSATGSNGQLQRSYKAPRSAEADLMMKHQLDSQIANHKAKEQDRLARMMASMNKESSRDKLDRRERERMTNQEISLANRFMAEKQVKNFDEVYTQYNKVKSIATMDPNKLETGANDLAIIFAYMKMLDPGSTVREGEFANAENAGGAYAKIGNLYNKVRSGQRLNQAQRSDFLQQAQIMAKQHTDSYNRIHDRYNSLAGRFGLSGHKVTGEKLNVNQMFGANEQSSLQDQARQLLQGK